MRRLAALVLSVVSLACGGNDVVDPGDGDPDPLGTLAVGPSTLHFGSLGGTASLQSWLVSAAGDSVATTATTWSVSPAGVVTVSSSGVVESVGNGAATVTGSITDGTTTSTGAVAVTVEQAVASVTVAPDSVVLIEPGDTVTVVATVRDALGSEIDGAALGWSSLDPLIATVDAASGLVTGVAPGTTSGSVEAVAGGDTASADFPVEVMTAVLELEPGDSCGDYTPEHIASFSSQHLQNVVRDTLHLGPGEDMTCALLATIDSLLVRPYGLAVNSVVGVQNLVGLDFLDLAGNNISDITEIGTLTGLSTLLLASNQIDDVGPLSTLTSVTALSVYDNDVVDLSPLSGLTQLTTLQVGLNPISGIAPLSGLTNLTVLGVDHAHLDDVSPLSGLTSLDELFLNDNDFTDVSSLAGLTGLVRLWIQQNEVTDISSLSGLNNLVELNVEDAELTDLDGVEGMTSLEDLNVRTNHISDLTPLAGLGSLRILEAYDQGDVADNAIRILTDISPLQGLTNLEQVILHTNQSLSDIQPLLNNAGLGAGDFVHLTFTAVSCTDVDALRAKGVTVTKSNCPA